MDPIHDVDVFVGDVKVELYFGTTLLIQEETYVVSAKSPTRLVRSGNRLSERTGAAESTPSPALSAPG